jgi:hypothetical protein
MQQETMRYISFYFRHYGIIDDDHRIKALGPADRQER